MVDSDNVEIRNFFWQFLLKSTHHSWRYERNY